MTRLATLAALLTVSLGYALAQDPSKVAYPMWVTNDYSCVIKCISDQIPDGAQPPASDGQRDGALGCVKDACDKSTLSGNIYQATYILNMFNAIGSIYEPQSWQDGNAPDASDLSAPSGWSQTASPTTVWGEDGQPTTTTTTNWVPPAQTTPPQPIEQSSTVTVSPTTIVPTTSTTRGAPISSTVSPSSSISGSAGVNGTGNGTTDGSGARLAIQSAGGSLGGLAGLVVAVMGVMVGGIGVL